MDVDVLKSPAGPTPDPAGQLSSAFEAWAAARAELGRLRALRPPRPPSATDHGPNELQARISSQEQLCAQLRLDLVRSEHELAMHLASRREDAGLAGDVEPRGAAPIHILLVDDEPRNLTALEAVLEHPDYRLVRATSGEEALAAFGAQEFACLLVDVRMPGMTGFELARKIKERPRTRQTPIIFLTAHDQSEEHALEGYACGAVDYLHKPFRAAELRQKVDVFADLHRVNRQLQAKVSDGEKLERGAASGGHEAASRQRAGFAAHAGRVLAQAQDLDEAMAAVLELCVPLLGDGAGLALVDADGELRRVAVHLPPGAHDAEVARADLCAEARRTSITREARTTRGAERAGIACPLVVCGRVMGLLHVQATAAALDESRCALVLDFASRAALVLEGARLEALMQQAGRDKERLIAMLAHELRNPLSPIATAAQVIRKQVPPESAAARASEVISRQAEHLARLVSRLLDGASSVGDKLVLDLSAHALTSIIQRAVQLTAAQVHGRNQSVIVDIHGGDPVVSADAARLVQVLANLVDNASRFSAPGSEIRVTLASRGPEAQVSVRDTGSGIAPEFLPHVFELFAQGEQPVDRPQGGLGIGLALAKRIVERHGGRLHAASAGPGQGTEMTVCLPLAPVRQDEAATRQGTRGRVLVVDRRSTSSELLLTLLGNDGHDVRLASDIASALRVAAAFRPDAVVVDVELPGMQGPDFVRELRAACDASGSMLIALAGNADLDGRSQVSGFDAFLAKPLEFELLLQVLAAVRQRKPTSQRD